MGAVARVLPKSIVDLLTGATGATEFNLAGWLRDGSVFDATAKPMQPMVVERDEFNTLKAGDSERIASALRRQAALVRDAGGEAIFFVVPRYQTGIVTPADRIVANAFRQVSGLHILDVGGVATSPEYFFDAAHPSHLLFRMVLTRAKENGWTSAPGGAPSAMAPANPIP